MAPARNNDAAGGGLCRDFPRPGNLPLLGTTVVLALLGYADSGMGQPVTATIYVGRHFEIRDHDQPTKYVFDGSTRIAAITGSLSPNQRVQRLRLFAGWNLCSLAVSGPFPASGAETISAAYQWNSATAGYSQITPGQSLAAGTVLWINALSNSVLSVAGAYTDPVPQPLQSGGAYFPGAGLEAWAPELPASASSWQFDAQTTRWSDHLAGALAVDSDPPPTIAPGQAFYIQTTTPGALGIPDPTLRIRYYHQDHLGSSAAITDAGGALVEETAFYPFGIARNQYRPRQLEERYQFTQKERDSESGLDDFEMRYLAPALGRFLTPDLKYACPDRFEPNELSAFVETPQQLQLYAYVRNNPLKLIDPMGEDDTQPKKQAPSSDDTSTITLTLDGGGETVVIPVNSLSLGEGGGSSQADKAAKASHDIVITKEVDQSSPTLMRLAAQGQPENGVLEARHNVNGHSEVYLKVQLSGVVITGVVLSDSHGHNPSSEQVALNAAKIEIKSPQEEKATESPANEALWLMDRCYATPQPAPSPQPDRGWPYGFMFSTGRPAERQAAESCGSCATELSQ